MKFAPHKWQQIAIDHAVERLLAGGRTLYASPTGTGKSVVELGVQERLPGCWIVSPRTEIIDGMIDKGGSEATISTPIKLRNRLLKGEVEPPKYILFDEGHHHNAESWQQVSLLAGLCPCAAYTATPYRGSPKSTRELREFFGEPLWLLTFSEAVEEGYISLPTFDVLPLVDDDVVEVTAGDFSVESLIGATIDRLGDMAEQSRAWHDGTLWDRPTIYALPSSVLCERLQRELYNRNLPAVTVSASTPPDQRKAAFDAVKKRAVAILHINIVSEGVDLPLRRLVDLSPTLSPVRWVQQLGRITRPVAAGEAAPNYVCTNRNLFRHAYTLEGNVPTRDVMAAERAFPPSTRDHVRVLGLEAVGRFKSTAVRLANGLTVHMYTLTAVSNSVTFDYCVLIHPSKEPVWVTKVRTVSEDGKQWGTWQCCEAPADMRGFASVGQGELSPKQRNWWNRAAANFGLDPAQEVNRKNFAILPILADTGVRL